MSFLNDFFEIIGIALSKWWRGKCRVQLDPTGNDLARSYKLKERRFEFYCQEFRYLIKSENWWCADNKFYLYKVTMLNEGVTSEGFYPKFTSWHINHSQHSHHLAIRAHIQLNSKL